MRSEARRIILALSESLVGANEQDYRDIQQALFLGEHDLTGQPQIDAQLISRLANYITYTVFSKRLRLTTTQSLLVSQLMALGRRNEEVCADPTQFYGGKRHAL